MVTKHLPHPKVDSDGIIAFGISWVEDKGNKENQGKEKPPGGFELG